MESNAGGARTGAGCTDELKVPVSWPASLFVAVELSTGATEELESRPSPDACQIWCQRRESM